MKMKEFKRATLVVAPGQYVASWKEASASALHALHLPVGIASQAGSQAPDPDAPYRGGAMMVALNT